MTCCMAAYYKEGEGTYFCTLTKREHRGTHKAKDTKNVTVKEWPGKFQEK